VGSCGLNASGSRQGQVAGCCEHGDEPSRLIKGGEFLEYVKNGSVPWRKLVS
jgi:hypothetical protein